MITVAASRGLFRGPGFAACSLLLLLLPAPAATAGSLPLSGWVQQQAGIDVTSLPVAPSIFGGENGVRGMRALRALRQDEKVLELPLSVIIRAETVRSDPRLGPALLAANLTASTPAASLPDLGILAVFLVAERARGEDSAWWPYLSSLPRTHYSPFYHPSRRLSAAETALFCAASQARYGQCPELEDLAEARASLVEAYNAINTQLFTTNRTLFPAKVFSLEAFAWSCATIVTRSFSADKPGEKWLIPFADHFNHHGNSDFARRTRLCVVQPGAAAPAATNAATNATAAQPKPGPCKKRRVSYWYNQSKQAIAFHADQDYEAGDQVFISYGALSNARLLRTYGFVLRGKNAHDTFAVPIISSTTKLTTESSSPSSSLPSVSTETLARATHRGQWLSVPYLLRQRLLGAARRKFAGRGQRHSSSSSSSSSDSNALAVHLGWDGPTDHAHFIAVGRILTLVPQDLDAAAAESASAGAAALDPAASDAAAQWLEQRIVGDGEQITHRNDAAMYMLLAQSIERVLKRFPTSLRTDLGRLAELDAIAGGGDDSRELERQLLAMQVGIKRLLRRNLLLALKGCRNEYVLRSHKFQSHQVDPQALASWQHRMMQWDTQWQQWMAHADAAAR